MKCPYDKTVDCQKITIDHLRLGKLPCIKCSVPNPHKAKYFNMPELYKKKKEE